MHLFRSSLLLLLLAAGLAGAGELRVVGVADRDPPLYAPGEKVRFAITLTQDGRAVAGRKLTWLRKGDDGRVARGAVTSALEAVVIEVSQQLPGFILLEVAAHDASGRPAKDDKGRGIAFRGGAGVAPERLAGPAEPADFDAFWQAQKAVLAAVPPKATLVPVAASRANIEVFDVRVACAGGKPVSGYLARPKGAAPRSLPILVSFHGYGIRSAARPEGRAARGLLAMDVNAHGIPNGESAEFYRQLGEGELKGYGFKGNAAPTNSVFLPMMLRALRAVEFLKAQPEWDGRNVVVIGGSQGGLQAVTVAALDPQVTYCMVVKPWLCDLSGSEQGRLGGWHPPREPGLGYFDAANHAKRVTCDAAVDAGLGDTTCPPSGVTLLYNNLRGAKSIVYIQGATHLWNPPRSRTARRALDEHLARILPAP